MNEPTKHAPLYDGSTFELGGLTFTVKFEPDNDMGPPWDEHDGHGPVRECKTPHWYREGSKRPGERPLNKPDRHEIQYYYDWQAACQLARKEGWNTQPYDAPNRIERAVQADFDYCRRYLSGDWQWMGVIVTCEETGGEESLWGIDGDHDNYLTEVAYELAAELVSQHEQALAIAESEKVEVQYWAARDVVTVPEVRP